MDELRRSIAHVLVRRGNLSVVVPVEKTTTVGKLKRYLTILLNYRLFPQLETSDIVLRYPEDVVLSLDDAFLDDLSLFKKDMPTLFMLFSPQEPLSIYEPEPERPDEKLLENAMQRHQSLMK